MPAGLSARQGPKAALGGGFCGHLGMPELRRVPGMALMWLSPLWDGSLDLHKAGWVPSELLGHRPPKAVGQVLGDVGFAGTRIEPQTSELLLIVHVIIYVGG